MNQGPKLPSRQPVPRLRDKAPRFQRREAAGDTPCRSALRGLVRLLARQAAQETFDDGHGPEAH